MQVTHHNDRMPSPEYIDNTSIVGQPMSERRLSYLQPFNQFYYINEQVVLLK